MKNAFFVLICCCSLVTAVDAQLNWQHTNGPEGAGAGGIFTDSIYAYCPSPYYLYRSSDGLSWEKLQAAAIWPMSAYGNTLAGQFFELRPNFLDDHHLRISHDHGVTWTSTKFPPGVYYTFSLAVCSHGIYIPGSANNATVVFRSTDEGQTWETLNIPPIALNNMWSFDNRVYISDMKQLYRTDTSGENWTLVSPALNNDEYVNDVLAYQNHILINTGMKIRHSHDGGHTWGEWPLPYRFLTRAGNMVYGKGWPTGLARSADFGATWTALPTNFGAFIDGFGALGDQLLVSTKEKVILRWDEDAYTTVLSSQGLSSAAVYGLAGSDNSIWATTGFGIYQYEIPTKTWVPAAVPPSDTSYFDGIVAADKGLVCAFASGSNFFLRTRNGGLNWDAVSPSGLTLPGIARMYIVDGKIFVLDKSGGSFRSDDQGDTWKPPFGGVTAYSPVEFQKKYYAVTQDSNLLRSDDQGETWINTGLIQGKRVLQLYATGDQLFACLEQINNNIAHQSLYTSIDGINWTYAHTGLPDNISFVNTGGPVKNEIRFFIYQGICFCYHYQTGLFASSDHGKTWLLVEARPYLHLEQHGSMLYLGTNGGGVFEVEAPAAPAETFSGVVYLDDNNNGQWDFNELPLPGVLVSRTNSIYGSSFSFYQTNFDGSYVLGVSSAQTDTIRVLPDFPQVENINPPFYISQGGGQEQHFGVYRTPGILDLAVSANTGGRPRPGFSQNLYFNCRNEGTTLASGQLSVRLDSHFQYISATPPPDVILADSLVWNFNQLHPLDKSSVKVAVKIPANVPLNTPLETRFRVQDALGTDTFPDNNLYVLPDTTTGSFDPNEKIAWPADGLSLQDIADGKEIVYTIKFQNTGTFPAERVRISDKLDAALDLPSCRLVGASHPVSLFRMNPGGFLEVEFDQIGLPDSTSNEPDSHGYVSFAVRPKQSPDADHVFQNYAFVFFDYNDPILTNTISTPIKTPVSVFDPGLDAQPVNLILFPNPARQWVTLQCLGSVSGAGIGRIYTASGQLCSTRQIADLLLPSTIDIGALPQGLYFVQVQGRFGTVTGKLEIH